MKLVEKYGSLFERYGILTSDKVNVQTKDVFRMIVDRLIEHEVVYPEFVETINVDVLDGKIPIIEDVNEMTPFVPEGAEPRLGDTAKIRQISFTLKKAKDRIRITKEAMIRHDRQVIQHISLDAMAKRLALREDQEVLDEINKAVIESFDAHAKWTESDADPVSDIAEAIRRIKANVRLTAKERKSLCVVIPDQVESYLRKYVIQIGGGAIPLYDYIESRLGVKIVPHVLLTKQAFVLPKSTTAVVHLVYDGKDIPLVQEIEKPEADSIEYYYTKYFATIPIVNQDGKCPFIVRIDNVL